jgi:hypothetical protein
VPFWSPEIHNNLLFNLRKAMVGCVVASTIVNISNKSKVEPVHHYYNALQTLNLAYEWPRNKTQWSIFLREATKIPNFWSGLRKK